MTKNSFRALATGGVGVVVVGLLAVIGVARAEPPMIGPPTVGSSCGLTDSGWVSCGGTPKWTGNNTIVTTTVNNPSHCVITLPRPMVPGPGGERASITWEDDTGHETGGWPGGPRGCEIKEQKP